MKRPTANTNKQPRKTLLRGERGGAGSAPISVTELASSSLTFLLLSKLASV